MADEHAEWESAGSFWMSGTTAARSGSGSACPLRSVRGISERVLAEEKATAGDRWYRHEYLSEFVDRQGAVFSRTVIDGAHQDYPGLAL